MKITKRKAAQVTTPQAKAIEFKQLHARVFRYASSKADERYFRSELHVWLMDNPATRRSWETLLYDMIAKVNTNAELKYGYMNVSQQRIAADRDFKTWAYATAKQMHALLMKIYAE